MVNGNRGWEEQRTNIPTPQNLEAATLVEQADGEPFPSLRKMKKGKNE